MYDTVIVRLTTIKQSTWQHGV